MASIRFVGLLALMGSLAISTKPENLAEKNISFLKCAGPHRQINPAILFAEDFEGNNPLETAHARETGTKYALSFVNAPVFQGKKAARFELRKTDPLVKGGKRAEVVVVPAVSNKERWYAFAVYFPASGYPKDSQQEVICQWWQRPDYHLGEEAGSPPTALRVKNDRFLLDVAFSAAKVASTVDRDTRRKLDLGAVEKDVWHEFVFHIIHAYQEDGLIEVWHNGKKILNHPGGNIYNNLMLPKWKLGVYKASFKNGKSEVDKRVLYFDNIRVGNEQATFEDMAPSTAFIRETK